MNITNKIKELFIELYKQGEIPHKIDNVCDHSQSREIEGFTFNLFYDCGEFDYIEDVILPCGSIYDPWENFSKNDMKNMEDTGMSNSSMSCWSVCKDYLWMPEEIDDKDFVRNGYMWTKKE